MAKKTAIVKNTEVNSKINLSINQNDLIDIIIEQESEKLYALIEAKVEELKQHTNLYSVLIKKQETDVFKNYKSKMPKELKFLTESPDSDIDLQGLYISPYVGSLKLDTISYHTSDFENALEKANPLANFKRNTRKKTASYSIYYKEACLKFKLTLNNSQIIAKMPLNIRPSQAKKLCADLWQWYQTEAKLKDELYELQLEYLKIISGTKTIKNKIVKQILNNSEEGKNVLTSLERIKFLELPQ